MKKCIYCNKDKEYSDFSTLEHILPSTLGGKILNCEIFRTRNVCNLCNNMCGMFVDSAISKNVALMLNEQIFIKRLEHGGLDVVSYPLYMGMINTKEKLNSTICERWMQTGATCFLYYPYDENFLTNIMGNPRYKKNDCTGIIYIHANAIFNEKKIKQVLTSFIQYFRKKAKLYSGNFEVPNEYSKKILEITNLPKEYSEHATSEISKKQFSGVVACGGKCDEFRFFSKLALGLGANLCGEQYLSGTSANEHRKILFPTRYSEEGILKGNIHIHEKVLGGSEGSVKESWRFGNSIAIIYREETLYYVLTLNGKAIAEIVIGENEETKSCQDKYKNIIFLWSPMLNKSLGPISIDDFVTHKYGSIKNHEIEQYESPLIAAYNKYLMD